MHRAYDALTIGWRGYGMARARHTAVLFAVACLATAGLLAGNVVAADQAPQAQPLPAGYAGSACTAARPGRARPSQDARPAATQLTVRRGRSVRTLRVHLPAGYSAAGTSGPRHGWPLVLSLHGTGSTAARQESGTGMDATADRYGFIVAYPQGGRRSGSGYAWVADDSWYLTSALALLLRTYCVATDRVYAAGFSGGARMLSGYACRPGTGLAAFAAVSGLRAPLPCRPGRGVAVVALHGTADRTNPYGGNGASYWTYSVPVAAQRWAGIDGCSARPATQRVDRTTTLTRYTGCRNGAAVELYTLAGWRHQWPRGQQTDANELIWLFFAAHPLT
ncbi:MAG: hypothetical protein J2P15_14445 [Micromonosporaceae bacterium]|nr:hypothetical protein [Micromonosporaceae bacterium]